MGFAIKKTNPSGKSIGKSPKTANICRKIAKSGWISTILVEKLTKHQARAYSGREALNRAHREAFRGKCQVDGNPETPGFYPALRLPKAPNSSRCTRWLCRACSRRTSLLLPRRRRTCRTSSCPTATGSSSNRGRPHSPQRLQQRTQRALHCYARFDRRARSCCCP